MEDDDESDALSDTTSMKLTKKKQRKEARKKARLAREGQKTEDPFTYYFGEMKEEEKQKMKEESRTMRKE